MCSCSVAITIWNNLFSCYIIMMDGNDLFPELIGQPDTNVERTYFCQCETLVWKLSIIFLIFNSMPLYVHLWNVLFSNSINLLKVWKHVVAVVQYVVVDSHWLITILTSTYFQLLIMGLQFGVAYSITDLPLKCEYA